MSGRHPNFMFVRVGRVVRLGCFWVATCTSVLSELTVLALQLPMLAGDVKAGENEGHAQGLIRLVRAKAAAREMDP